MSNWIHIFVGHFIKLWFWNCQIELRKIFVMDLLGLMDELKLQLQWMSEKKEKKLVNLISTILYVWFSRKFNYFNDYLVYFVFFERHLDSWKRFLSIFIYFAAVSRYAKGWKCVSKENFWRNRVQKACNFLPSNRWFLSSNLRWNKENLKKNQSETEHWALNKWIFSQLNINSRLIVLYHFQSTIIYGNMQSFYVKSIVNNKNNDDSF